jgi:ELWxxDGT repeat protein
LYFTAYEGIAGRELWSSDGTEDGTVMVKDINPGSFDAFPRPKSSGYRALSFVGSKGVVYFPARDGGRGTELWVSDGTAPGTALAFEINPFGDGLAYSGTSRGGWGLVAVGDVVYFKGYEGSGGGKLWAVAPR